jgi:hypothetical protein
MNNQLPKLTTKEMWNEMLKFFYFQKGIPKTFLSLIKQPYETVNEYLTIDRRKYFNPLNYILIAAGLYALVLAVHPGFTGFIKQSNELNAKNYKPIEDKFDIDISGSMKKSQRIYMSYQNIFYIVILPIIGYVTFLLAKEYNYAEHMALNAFVFGTSTWVSLILSILTIFFKNFLVVFIVIPLVSFIVMMYMYKKIFQISWPLSFGVTFLIYFVILIASMIMQLGLSAYFMIT